MCLYVCVWVCLCSRQSYCVCTHIMYHDVVYARCTITIELFTSICRKHTKHSHTHTHIEPYSRAETARPTDSINDYAIFESNRQEFLQNHKTMLLKIGPGVFVCVYKAEPQTGGAKGCWAPLPWTSPHSSNYLLFLWPCNRHKFIWLTLLYDMQSNTYRQYGSDTHSPILTNAHMATACCVLTW